MNIAEIELQLKDLVEQEFDDKSFVHSLLEIYNAPRATITKLKQGSANYAKNAGEVLWKNKLFYRVAERGQAAAVVDALAADPLITKHKPRFLLATDGAEVYARDTKTDRNLDIAFGKLNDAFDFFLPLAGIERYEAVAENPADIKATGRLAKLYDAILEANPDWIGRNYTHELDIFMTRMLFCFFAEDTSIFEKDLFTSTLMMLTQEDGSNTAATLETLFTAMKMPADARAGLPEYARRFPYVNGGLFREKTLIPKFSRRARRLMKECGDLNWSEINPDIFGSMIQAIVEPEMLGDMGLHYTSVPNIMKALQPLFLLSLEEEFESARSNETKLNRLLDRIYNLRLFDPACGSGNFLIIAYRELRKLETRIFQRLKAVAKQWSLPMTGVRLTQFYGIELADFAVETAKLSLWIAEYQMNEQFKAVFGAAPPALPLTDSGNIVQGNAAELDWRTVCPIEQRAEQYIVGNPPFEGARGQSEQQKKDVRGSLAKMYEGANSLDYVCIWFQRASEYINRTTAEAAFVATNSICQGQSISLFWSKIIASGIEIGFAYRPFRWRNNATKNAAVMCVIVGIRKPSQKKKALYDENSVKFVANISPYLTDNIDIFVKKRSFPPKGCPPLVLGNQAIDGGYLIMPEADAQQIIKSHPEAKRFFRPIYGANDFVQSTPRFCVWVKEKEYEDAKRYQSWPEDSKRWKNIVNAVVKWRVAWLESRTDLDMCMRQKSVP
jgi:hypothetical protein